LIAWRGHRIQLELAPPLLIVANHVVNKKGSALASQLHSKWKRTFSLIAVAPFCVMMIGGLTSTNWAVALDSTVTFAFWGDPAEQAAYERVVTEFETANPGIDIKTDYTPGQGDYLKKLATSFAGGNAPDLFLINYRTFGQYAATDALQPIDSYLQGSTTIKDDDYYEVALDAFRFDDIEQTCMPQNISSLVVYYNEDLFNANGVTLPTDDWTFSDFEAAAKALTRDTDGDGAIDTYGLGVEQSLYRASAFVWANDGELVDNVANPTTLTLDRPEAVEALTWFQHLGASGIQVVPSEVEAQAEDDEARFMRGGSGMFLQSRRAVPTLREIDGFAWNVAPLPTGKERATVLHSDAFCMSASAQEKDAAWAFTEFAVGEAGQTILVETGRVVPSLMRIAESDAFLNPVVDEVALLPANNQVFLDNIQYLHRLPNISTWLEVEDIFNAKFERIFYDKIDILSLVAETTEATLPIFERAATD